MMHFGWKCGVVLGVSMVTLAASCSSGEPLGKDAEHVAAEPSALTRQFSISLPRFAPLGDVVVGALVGGVAFNDRARLAMESGIPGVTLSPVIAARGEVNVGSQAVVGAVVSRGKVILRSSASARSVTTAATLDRQQGGVVAVLEEGANLEPADVTTFTFTVPDASQGDQRTFPRGPVLDLAPNRYGSLTVASNSLVRLRSGVYRFESLLMEPDGALELDNAGGQVVVLVGSGFVYRGRIRETAPALANVLFIHEGSSRAVVESAFRGTLLAPNGTIAVDAPAGNRTHAGAFIGWGVEIHQDQVIQHRAFRGAAPACDVAAFTEIQDHPFDRSRDTDNDLQGVALSADRWYFTNANAELCGLFSDCTFSHVWSYPLDANINDDVSNLTRNPWQDIYNHFGDISFVPSRAGLVDMLYIALESNGGRGGRGAIGFMSADLESHFGFAELGQAPLKDADQGGSMPWVAFHRGEDRAYSSGFSSAWLNAYEVRLQPGGAGLEAVHRRAVRFHDCVTGSPAFVARKQGADFSATGKLYISVDVQGGGVIVVDPLTGTIRDFTRVNFDPNGESEELEGVVVRNLDGGQSPGVGGHVHVLMIQNELDNDDHYFKHLRADDFSKL